MAIDKLRTSPGTPTAYAGEWAEFKFNRDTGGLVFTTRDTVIPARVVPEWVKIPVSGTAVHAGVKSWVIPEPASIFILRAILNITTASTGASTIDIGYTATSAVTSNDALLDGVSGTPAAIFDSADSGLDSGANDDAIIGASAKWITIAASGDTTGMVADLYIEYIPLEGGPQPWH